MSELSRRQFLKGSLAGAAAATLAGIGLGTTAFAEEKGIYTPGTYSATAKGHEEVTVTMTFDANSITDVKVDVSKETPTIGGLHGDELAKRIMDAQGVEIDAVSPPRPPSAPARLPRPALPRQRARPSRLPRPRSKPAITKSRPS